MERIGTANIKGIDYILSKLRKDYVLDKRDERLKVMSEWLREDSVLLESLRKVTI